MSNQKQSLVVKFNSKSAKANLMTAKRKFKEDESLKNVYKNDFLSKESMDLLNYSRTLNTVGYHAVYSYGGRIYAKKSAITSPRFIKNAEDVDNVLMEATTSTFHNRKSTQKQVIPIDDSDGSEDEDNSQFVSPAYNSKSMFDFPE